MRTISQLANEARVIVIVGAGIALIFTLLSIAVVWARTLRRLRDGRKTNDR